MKNLKALLERFSKSLYKDDYTRQAVVEAVFSTARVQLSPQDISLKDGILSIRAGATAKNEMKLKEGVIQETLKNLHNIRVSRIIYK